MMLRFYIQWEWMLAISLSLGIVNAAFTQTVGIGTDMPDAILDVTSANSGILIPRVGLDSTLDVTTVPSPVTSELIYNNATAGSGATSVTPGYYYWDGTKWVRLSTAYDHDWYEEGGTDSPDNINDTIYTYGFVGIGMNSPNAPLQVAAQGIGNPASNSIIAYNPNNNVANRDAIVAARVVPGEGDPFFSIDVAGESGWSIGMDNSHDNRFKIANDWSDLSGSAGAATKMTIKTTGEVGIGTDDPTQLVHLNFSGRNGLLLTGDGTDDAFVEIDNSGGSHYIFDDDSDGNNFVLESASDLNFSSGGANERMTILGTNGNVGIDVATPVATLDVSGRFKVHPQYSLSLDSTWTALSNANTGAGIFMVTITDPDGDAASMTLHGGGDSGIQYWLNGTPATGGGATVSSAANVVSADMDGNATHIYEMRLNTSTGAFEMRQTSGSGTTYLDLISIF